MILNNLHLPVKKKILTKTGKSSIGKVVNGLKFPPGVTINMRDKEYKFYDKEKVLKAMNAVPLGHYVPESYDCDDFSAWLVANIRSNPTNHQFPGIPLGEARGRYDKDSEFHSLVICWTSKDEYFFYEPQTRKVVDFIPSEIYI